MQVILTRAVICSEVMERRWLARKQLLENNYIRAVEVSAARAEFIQNGRTYVILNKIKSHSECPGNV